MANSHQIGKKHEDQVEKLLQDWRVTYEKKKKYKTNQGTIIELDFWLPPTNCRPAIVIECKTFGVEAKNPAIRGGGRPRNRCTYWFKFAAIAELHKTQES